MTRNHIQDFVSIKLSGFLKGIYLTWSYSESISIYYLCKTHLSSKPIYLTRKRQYTKSQNSQK